MGEFISISAVKNLWKQVLAKKGERKKELKKIAEDFGNSSFLTKYYVEPNCQHHNPSDYFEEESVADVRMPVFRFLNTFFSGEISKTSGAHQLFILADSGLGKTSLLVILKLMHLNGNWPGSHHCELLKLGPDTQKKVESIKKKGNTVLLLDALDEDQSSNGRVDLRLQRLLMMTGAFKRVVITCRTQFFPLSNEGPFDHLGKVRIGKFACPTFFLSPFNDEQVDAYLKKRYLRSPAKRKKAREIADKTHLLRFRPLMLSYIDELNASKIKKWNVFNIYDSLLNSWLSREEQKIKKMNRTVHARDLLRVCIKMAIYMQGKGVRLISTKEIDSLKERDSDLEQIELIDISERSLLNRNSLGDYHFVHYSIQEFLVAYGIAYSVVKMPRKPLRMTHEIINFLKTFDLRKISFECFNFANLYMFELSLEEALLNKAYMPGVRLENANLKGASMVFCNLRKANLSHSNLGNVNLESANLTGANLAGADLSGGNFVRSSCKGVDLTGANLWHTNFLKAELCDANLRDANLTCANLLGANLRGASLENTDLTLADFRSAAGYLTAVPLILAIKQAKYWWLALYDNGVYDRLGISRKYQIICLEYHARITTFSGKRGKIKEMLSELYSRLPDPPTTP